MTSASPTSLATAPCHARLSPATHAAGPTAGLVELLGFLLLERPQVQTPDRQQTTQLALDLATISILRQAICLGTTPCLRVRLSSLTRRYVSSYISTCGVAELVSSETRSISEAFLPIAMFPKKNLFLLQELTMRNCLQRVTTR